MAAPVRGFPVLSSKYWGGKGEVCGYNVGCIPHSGAPHVDHLECTGKGLAMCLCGNSSHKDRWCCGDEGTAPFNYFLWVMCPTEPEDKYPLNSNMSVRGQQVRGCILVIKLDATPSDTAKPVDITLGEVEAIMAANPLPGAEPASEPAPAPAARAAKTGRKRRQK